MANCYLCDKLLIIQMHFHRIMAPLKENVMATGHVWIGPVKVLKIPTIIIALLIGRNSVIVFHILLV